MMLMPRALNLLLAPSCAVLLIILPTRADQVPLYASADATLFGVSPTNSSGASEFFIAGTTQNHTTNRALLRFDIASAVPAGARIDNVDLYVEVIRQPGCGINTEPFGLHRMLRSWGEGANFVAEPAGGQGLPAMPEDATWLYAHAFSDPWGAPGGAEGSDFVQQI